MQSLDSAFVFGWNPFGGFGLLVMVLACALGLFVHATRPHRAQNRRLALALILGGLSAGFYFGVTLLADTEAGARLAIGIGITFLIPLPAVYLRFLATVRTGLTRALDSRSALWALIVYTVAVEVLWFLQPHAFVEALVYYPSIGGWHVEQAGPLLSGLALGGLAAAQMFGLLVVILAYRDARTASARDQAFAFGIAFGTRDLFGTVFIICFGVLPGLTWAMGPVAFVLGLPAIDLLFYLLLAYGILRTQLFDIHLRVKTAIRHGAIAAPFAIVFFGVSEALETVIPFDSFWLGLASAGGIVLLLRPIRSLAESFADRLMPGVSDTGAYIVARKHHVYRSAVEGVLEDGRITAGERRVLQRLRRELDIPPDEAARIEQGAERALTMAGSPLAQGA